MVWGSWAYTFTKVVENGDIPSVNGHLTEGKTHRSGFFKGLCRPVLGTLRKLFTNGEISETDVSGMLRKGVPLRGSGIDLRPLVVVHSPFTARQDKGAHLIVVHDVCERGMVHLHF